MTGINGILPYKCGLPNGIINSDAHVTQSQELKHLSIYKLITRFGFLLLQGMILEHVSSYSDVIHCIITLT